ncbi:hypothetical protein BGZ98_002832, partial [Dissophora globulifera]
MANINRKQGNIPSGIINWAAKSGIPTFLNSLRDAGQGLMKKEAAASANEKALPVEGTQVPVA